MARLGPPPEPARGRDACEGPSFSARRLAQPDHGHDRSATLVVDLTEGLAIRFGQLLVERGPVRGRQIDPSRPIVARYLAKATTGSLEDEVVARLEFARESRGKETRAIPALGALVDEKDHPMGGVGIVEAIEGVDLRDSRARRVTENDGRRETGPCNRELDMRLEIVEVIVLREIDGEFWLGRRPAVDGRRMSRRSRGRPRRPSHLPVQARNSTSGCSQRPP